MDTIIGASALKTTVKRIQHYEITRGDPANGGIRAVIFAEVDLTDLTITFKTTAAAQAGPHQISIPIEIMKIDRKRGKHNDGWIGEEQLNVCSADVISAFNMVVTPEYARKAQAIVEDTIRKMQFQASIAEAKARKIIPIGGR